MGKFLRHEACPECSTTGRGTSLAVYDDGIFCMECRYQGKNIEQKGRKMSKLLPIIETGIFRNLPTRGISKETCEFFNYQIGKYTGYIGNRQVRDEIVHIANYCNDYGEVVAQKLRDSQKQFTVRGDAKALDLYGKWKYPSNPNLFITICEGEIDALSLAEVQGKQYPVVSLPCGASSARKTIINNLEYLQGFKYVALGFDNDEAGIEAAKSCVDLFEPGKVKIITWPMKDVNELLVAGRQADIKEALWKAKEVRPDKIRSPSDLLSRIVKKPETGIGWPWQAMTECTLGLREQQLIVIGAATSIGKSELVKDIIVYETVHNKIPCGIFSFEQDASDTVLRVIGGKVGKPLHIPGEWWDEKVIEETAKELDGKLFVYDNWGGAKVEDLIPKMRYLAKGCGVKLFIIDHLTALAAKMDGNERVGLEKAMEMLASLSRELRCCIILVSHLSRDKAQGEESWGNGRMPILENLKGSSAIEAWSDAVFGLSRKADSDDILEKQTLVVQCLKARLNGAQRGRIFRLYYDAEKGTLKD